MVQENFLFIKIETSKRSRGKYRELQKQPICPICNEKFKIFPTMSKHFTSSHNMGRFSEWFITHYPNYCKKCGELILGKIQGIYRCECCSLSCKASQEFRSEKQKKAVAKMWLPETKEKIRLYHKTHLSPLKGRKKTEKHRKQISEQKKDFFRTHFAHNKGIPMAEEQKKKISESKRRQAEISYEGNLTRFQQIFRTYLYSIWTKPILEKDGFKCVQCGSMDKLSVHHIIPFRKLILEVLNCYPYLDIRNYNDKWKLHKACLEYPPLLDTNNGIALCVSCHRKYHKKGGIANKDLIGERIVA